VTRYWIDTDPGLDDALALLLALGEAADQVVGISSARGNVVEPVAARNLAGLMARFRECGLDPGTDAMQVARGARQPLIGGRSDRPDTLHDLTGLGNPGWVAPKGWERVGQPPAALSLARAAGELADLHLVCLGPLTNLALALHLEPELPERLGGLTIMGGSLRAGGNATPAAEFNFLADPEAAQLVLAAGFKQVGLVPIDACRGVQLLAPELERLRELPTPAARLADELLSGWAPRIQRPRGLTLYDAAAWLLTVHPELGRWEEVHLTVDTGAGAARGASLADWLEVGQRPPNVRVSMGIDRVALVEAFIAALA
jgi:purine nucleosidase